MRPLLSRPKIFQRPWGKLLASSEAALVVGWFAFFTALEFSRPWKRTEFHDSVGVAFLIVGALVTLRWHQDRPLASIAAMTGRLSQLKPVLGRWKVRFGFDLQEEPALPRRFPPTITLAVGGLFLGTGLLLAKSAAFPGVLRSGVGAVSQSLYTALLAVLWSAALFVGVCCFCIPLLYVQAALRLSRGAGRAPRRETLWAVGYFLALALAAVALPLWFPLALVGTTWILFALLAWVPRPPRLTSVWNWGRGEGLWSTSWAAVTVCVHVGVVLAYIGLVLVLSGSVVLGGPSSMPISAFFGVLVAWTFAGAFLAETLQMGRILWEGRFLDPVTGKAAPVRTMGVPDARRLEVQAAFEAAGLSVRFPGGKAGDCEPRTVWRRDEVETPAQARESWPREFGPAELADPDFFRGLRRRREILARRALLHGLRRIFKAASQQEREGGHGYWVAPHLWFVTHLGRDQEGEPLPQVGPSYRRACPREARRHFHQVLKSLGIDLIFLEDGISFRRFKRVLSLAFEYYDIFAGSRPIQTIHFSGVPGLRVLLDEYSLEASPRLVQYPEPDYEDLGRARILFVFRDRGELEEPIQIPDGWGWEPQPEPALLL